MAKNDRIGKRKTREQRKLSKRLELGYYLIVTDTQGTEKYYFDGLHAGLPKDIQNKLIIRVVETKTRKMIDRCMELMAYEAQYRIPWIVFDRDQVKDFDNIIKEATDKGIRVGWSNPCFEIWLYAYFGSMPALYESRTCCSEFGIVYERKVKQKYSKTDDGLYNKLNRIGKETAAITVAKQKYEQYLKDDIKNPSEMCPGTTVYILIEEISEKVLMAKELSGERASE